MGKLNSKSLSKLITTVYLSLFAFTIVIAFQNCGIQKPKVEDMSSLSSSFSHSPIPNSCVTCHAEAKPIVFKTLSVDKISNMYIHDPQYNGDQDCVLCHSQNQVDIGKTWQNGLFNHKLNTGATVTSCQNCHNGNRPTTGTMAHTSANGRMGDCATCHKNVGANWSTTAVSHSPLPVSCTSCHASNKPASTVYYPSNSAQPTLNLYVHADQFNGSADCATCHSAVPANAGVNWTGGVFNHKSNTGATVTSCQSCHSATRPSTHTAATGQTGDCVSCHTNAGVSWASASYSHSPIPTTCLSCHTSAKPATTTYFASNPTQPTLNLYAHTTAYNGAADCASCHTKVTANIGVRWSGGYYNHKTNTGTTIANCQDCHNATRPSSHTVASGQSGECVSCHTNAGVDWSASGGSAAPVNVTLTKPSSVSWANLTVAHPTIKTGMACTTCHVNYNSTASIKGYDHGSAPSGSKCVYCHYSGQQVVASGYVSTKSHNGASLSKDCNSCHGTGPSWNGTKFTGGSGW